MTNANAGNSEEPISFVDKRKIDPDTGEVREAARAGKCYAPAEPDPPDVPLPEGPRSKSSSPVYATSPISQERPAVLVSCHKPRRWLSVS